MLELAVHDSPDVVCLQELPVWAIGRLETWTSMWAAHSVARRPLFASGRVAGLITRRHQGLLRSALAGQANAILLSRGHRATDLGSIQISERGRERRTCHAVRVDDRIVVANLHASNAASTPNVMHAEIERALAFADARVRPGEPLVLAGDFNLEDVVLPNFSLPGPGVDQVLCRGAECSTVETWCLERRTVDGVVLSDHAPVEALVG
jgi:endonuclease/exonuclease/phosphatase family metal-dependent hydrolase